MFKLRTFGGLELRAESGEPVEELAGRTKALALLAYLAARAPDGRVPREEVAALLWPDRPGERARNALRVTLSRLRLSQDARLVGGEGVQHLWVDRDHLRADVTLFREALEAGERKRALELYRGDFLAGVRVESGSRFQRWADERRSEYRRRARETALTLAEQSRQEGDLGGSESAYRRALDLAPLNEEAAGGLIRVLAEQGKRADALTLYETFGQRLGEELDLSPSEELQELTERIRSRPAEVVGEEASGGAPVDPKPAAPEEKQPRAGWKTVRGLLITVLVAGLLALGLWLGLGGEGIAQDESRESAVPAGGSRPTVAVLPFENLSNTEDTRPFLEGLHSELLTQLSRVDGLDVTSRTSVLPYRGTEVGLSTLADTLGADWVVEGGVQRVDDRIRLNAQLIDPRTDTHAWAASYERELTAENLFGIQEELTRKIVRALNVELTPEDERQVASLPTENTAAYELYLQARRLKDGPVSEEDIDRRIRLQRRAIELDSSFAEAWAGLADTYVGRAWRNQWDRDRADSALAAARQALELDGELAGAHLQLGDAHWVLGNTERTLDAYRRAWELNPDRPGVTNNLQVLLAYEGRYAEKLKWLNRALRTSRQPAKQVGTLLETNVLLGRDSVADAWREYARRQGLVLTETEFAVTLLYRGEVERARSLLDELADGEETVADIRRRALLELYEGDWEQARDLYRRLYTVSGGGPGYAHGLFDDRVGLAWSLDRLGQKGEARDIAGSIREDAGEAAESDVPGGDVRHRLAVAHLLLADTARALDWLEKAVDAGERRLPLLKTAPTLDPLRDHPRFQALLDRVAEQLAAQRRQSEKNGWGEPPVRVATGDEG